jgi:hypothetical protein
MMRAFHLKNPERRFAVPPIKVNGNFGGKYGGIQTKENAPEPVFGSFRRPNRWLGGTNAPTKTQRPAIKEPKN